MLMLFAMAIEVLLDMTMHFTLYEQQSITEVETSMMESLKDGWAYVQKNEALRKVFIVSGVCLIVLICFLMPRSLIRLTTAKPLQE